MTNLGPTQTAIYVDDVLMAIPRTLEDVITDLCRGGWRIVAMTLHETIITRSGTRLLLRRISGVRITSDLMSDDVYQRLCKDGTL